MAGVMLKVLLNSGSSAAQGRRDAMRLNISSKSRRNPNSSSNTLIGQFSGLYRFFITSSSQLVLHQKQLPFGGSGERRSMFRPDDRRITKTLMLQGETPRSTAASI